MHTLIHTYFPKLSNKQIQQLHALEKLHHQWKEKLNLISTPSLTHFPLVHTLHSLSISRFLPKQPPNTHILDIGSGGGLPGIPLAICYPKLSFTLLDGTKKKTKALQNILQNLQLKHVKVRHERLETLDLQPYDLCVGRAVAPLHTLLKWMKRSRYTPPPLWYLTGEKYRLPNYAKRIQQYNLADTFQEKFFIQKCLLLIHLKPHPPSPYPLHNDDKS